MQKPTIKTLIIGGSGAYDLDAERFGPEKETVILPTPYGDAAPVRILEVRGRPVGLLSRHGVQGYDVTAPDVNYRANIYAAKELGVDRIIAWSGPGAIRGDLRPGDLILPDDLIDLTRGRGSTFFQGKGIGFIRMNPVFCPQIREVLTAAAASQGTACRDGGTYVCTQGPRLETPAEVRFLERIGGDVVGMTLAPECFLARELEICYAPLCYISNYAEGVRDLPYREGVLFEGTLPDEDRDRVRKALSLFPSILVKALELLDLRERDCPCGRSMLRYRRQGRIQEDWRTWIS